jgi:hypothetical protein
VLLNTVCAIALVFGTVLIHAVCTVLVLTRLHAVNAHHWALRGPLKRTSVMVALVLLLSAAIVLESLLWAGLYVLVGALPTLSEALYFSLVTFTTLGYGDITLHEPWRMLAAFQAATGILIFGWTTAIIVAVGQRVFLHPSRDGQ